MVAFPGEADLIGGHVVLDFVNTVSWRGDPARRVDRLADFPTFVSWAVAAGALVRPTPLRRVDPATGARALRRARQVREALHGTLAAAAGGVRPDLLALQPIVVDAIR